MPIPFSVPAAPLRLYVRLWRSPSVATAASIGARALALFAPVPFLTGQFTDAVVALWFVFMTFQSIVAALNGTLPVVFMHLVSYERARAPMLNGSPHDQVVAKWTEPSGAALNRICRLILKVFTGIAAIWLLLAATAGTFVILEPASRSGLGAEAWLAWAVFSAGAGCRIVQQGYISYILGSGEIAPVRRLEAMSWFAGGAGALLVLWLAPSFLGAVALLQLPQALNIFLLARMAKRLGWAPADSKTRDAHLLGREVLPRAWRGSLGVLASNGAVYGSGLFFAQVGESMEVAGYLFALSIMGILRTLAMSPYLARMPMLARLWAKGELPAQNRLATDGIALSMAWFAALSILVPIGMAVVNGMFNSDLLFVDAQTWAAMVSATALLRYGALHVQYYTVTNHVVWHIVDSVNSVLFLALLALMFDGSAIVFPLAQGIALMIFYVPYARYLTYTRFGLRLAEEIPRSALPVLLAVFLLWSAVHLGLA